MTDDMTTIEAPVLPNMQSPGGYKKASREGASSSAPKLNNSSLKKTGSANNKLFLDSLFRSSNKQDSNKKDESIDLKNKHNYLLDGAMQHGSNQLLIRPYNLDVVGGISDDVRPVTISCGVIQHGLTQLPTPPTSLEVSGRQSTEIHSAVINKYNATKQIVGNKDRNKSDVELCAFSTYKLSYMDQLSGKYFDVKVSVRESNRNDTHPHESAAKESSASLENELVKFGIPGQEVINKYLEDPEIVDEPALRIIAEQATLYEKYKISVVGEEQRTVIIRDYANDLELDTGDIRSLLNKSAKNFDTIIFNGKEI